MSMRDPYRSRPPHQTISLLISDHRDAISTDGDNTCTVIDPVLGGALFSHLFGPWRRDHSPPSPASVLGDRPALLLSFLHGLGLVHKRPDWFGGIFKFGLGTVPMADGLCLLPASFHR